MPKTKGNIRPRIKHSLERLELIDMLLQKYKHIPNREDFLSKVNRRLPSERQISGSSLDKDISYLRTLIKDADSDVKLLLSGTKGYHYSVPGYSYFKNSITDDDKELLELAHNLFRIFNGTSLQNKFGEIVNKVLAESLTGGQVHGLEENRFIEIESESSNTGSIWIERLLKAIFSKQALEMQYKGFGKPLRKKYISPYLLKQFRNRWYLVAHDRLCDRPEKTNVFAVDCIRDLQISNKEFITDDNFSASDYFKYSLGVWHWHEKEPIKVELEFSDQIEMIQQNPLHHSQQTKLMEDGKKMLVQLEVYPSPELEMLIMGFGEAVKVLSPSSLAEAIVARAKKMIAAYKL